MTTAALCIGCGRPCANGICVHCEQKEREALANLSDASEKSPPPNDLEFAPELPKVEHTWHPIDLVAAAAVPPEPPTIGGMLYPGKRTLLSGETESLKTWLALILAKAELDAGYVVGWADLDAMGKGEIYSRLRALGVPDEKTSQSFLFYEPDDSLTGLALDDVTAELKARSVRLFVIDAFNSMLNLHGLDPMKTPDVETFWREIAQPICNTGATPTMLDHVVKNADNRGRYAYGSERKATGSHIHIGFKQLQEFKRGGTGRTLLYTRKDRAGFLPRPELGILELVSSADGLSVSYSLQPDRSHRGDKFRPTFLMQRVSEFLAGQDDAVARKTVSDNVQGKDEALKAAMDVLVEEGYVRQTDGKRGAKLLEFVRQYREEDDVDESEPTSSRPLPDLFPNLVSLPSLRPLPSSPLLGKRSKWARPPLPQTLPHCSVTKVSRNSCSLHSTLAVSLSERRTRGTSRTSSTSRRWLRDPSRLCGLRPDRAAGIKPMRSASEAACFTTPAIPKAARGVARRSSVVPYLRRGVRRSR